MIEFVCNISGLMKSTHTIYMYYKSVFQLLMLKMAVDEQKLTGSRLVLLIDFASCLFYSTVKHFRRATPQQQQLYSDINLL